MILPREHKILGKKKSWLLPRLTSAKMGLYPLAAISENMLSLSFINWGNNDDQNDGMGWCFYWAEASGRPGKPRPLTSKYTEQGLSKIIWEGRREGFCCQGLFFFFFFISWLNYALVSWNSLSIIPLGLGGTQGRTDQLQAPGFLNPANKLITGSQQMFLHLRHRLYYSQLAPPAGAKPSSWRCRAWQCTCMCA